MEGTHFKQPAIGGSIKRKYVNPDLQQERDNCNFDQEEVEKAINVPGVREYYSKFAPIFEKYPQLKNPKEYVEMTRVEQQKH